MNEKKLAITSLFLSLFLLTGCGAMSTAIKKRNLEVNTQMSQTIWLEPSNQKSVYIQIKNTSDKDMSGLESQISNELKSKGYSVISSPP